MRVESLNAADADAGTVVLRPRQDGFIAYVDRGKRTVTVTLADGRTGDAVSVPVMATDVKAMIDALSKSLKAI